MGDYTFKTFFNDLAAVKAAMITRVSSQPESKSCLEILQRWAKDVDSLTEGDVLLDHGLYNKGDEKDTLRYKILNTDASDEKIIEAAKNKGSFYREEELSQLLAATRAILSPGKAFEIITAPFEDEDVLTVCTKYKKQLQNPQYGGLGEHKTAIRDGVRRFRSLPFEYLPKGFSTELAKFMTTNFALLTFLEARQITHNDEYTTREPLIALIEKCPLEEKDKIVSMIAESPVRPSLDKAPFADLVVGMARGLSPVEFDQLLSRTGLLETKKVPEHIDVDHFAAEVNAIAVNALLHFQPESYKETDAERIGGLHPPIEKVTDYATAKMFEEDARRIVSIAFKHCKGLPRNDLKNHHTPG